MNDPDIKPAVRVDRALTDDERTLARWMLENGTAEAVSFLGQLERARVVEHCSCGCATIGFKIEGFPEAPPGVGILGDFLFGEGDSTGGAFIFESNGILSGLEVFGFGADAPTHLPKPEDLRSYDSGI